MARNDCDLPGWAPPWEIIIRLTGKGFENMQIGLPVLTRMICEELQGVYSDLNANGKALPTIFRVILSQ